MRNREDLKEGNLLVVHPTETALKPEILEETCMFWAPKSSFLLLISYLINSMFGPVSVSS